MSLWKDRTDPEREQRGERARQLLADELLVEALDAIEESCVGRWKLAQTKNAREDEWRALEAARSFRRTLELIVLRGKEAASRRTLRERTAEKAAELLRMRTRA